MKKIRELTDEQLWGIIQFDCATSPYIPIDRKTKKEFVMIGGIKKQARNLTSLLLEVRGYIRTQI